MTIRRKKMRNHRPIERLLVVLVLASLVLTSAPIQAQNPGQNQGQSKPPDYYEQKAAKTKERQENRVSPAERQAAADQAKAAGFVLPKMGTAVMQAAGTAPHYFSHPNYANSPLPTVISGTTTITITGGIQKFVDPLPWAPGGDPMPVAAKAALGDGSDYYEIGLVQYRQIMHRDLAGPTGKGTLLRGYVQLKACTGTPADIHLYNEMLDGSQVDTGYCGETAPSYLGPAIIAQKDTPVRILFRNLLPAGIGGNLFIPTDTSVMGSGMGPDLRGMPEVDPQNPTCDASSTMTKTVGCFTENRADLHLHGGLTPWISDGTPHQWITPKDETLPYPDANLLADPTAPDHGNAVENKGVSVEYVPDMWYDAAGNWISSCFGQINCGVTGATNNPGRGAQTYYYTNQQSARLLFYHDHAWGITRLNVYAGEAAPYLIQDSAEITLTNPTGALHDLGIGIPLVLQDKTFVPTDTQLAVSDNTWDASRWGGLGNLWLPHVYSPAQNAGDSSGVNQFGRWAYGPWFWPPTSNIAYGPIPNPYAGQDAFGNPGCDPDVTWCEPPLMPGTPYNSMGMEAFHDTPVVNGKAYPTLELAPGEYRFRILNAASDRSFSLSLYQADASGTEVALNAAEVAAALADPTVFPTPDTAVSSPGPAWVQIGTEGGFLPAPVVIPAQPITWVTDPTVFNAGNVDKHALLLGPAERADVVVDLTPFAGKTLILYNDAPAAFPARDPRYDYYTGNADLRDTGGAPSTLPGYGPNTRTVMQIKVTGVGGAATPDWVDPDRLAALQAAFAHNITGTGVFESSQHPIIVGQGAYNSAYGSTFQNNGPNAGLVQIFDMSTSFKTLSGGAAGPSLTMALGTKAIQDEMGESFDRDYGRMSGNLGLEVPLVPGTAQNLILYPYVNPASELIDATSLPRSDVAVAPISVADDGTQIWKITHNGVDTHPIHFHLFDVQLINRVGWDGIIRKVDLNELGWKDTVRISPLEDTIVALRPVVPVVPFDLPNSFRPLNPAMPTGSSLMFTNLDATANPTPPIVNLWTNFGWEYVWHCHILSHEEMDMMRPISVSAPPRAPVLSGVRTGTGNNRRDNLTWTDTSKNETGFSVFRAPTASGPWTSLITLAANTTAYSSRPPDGNPYFYQVVAINTVGYSATAGYSTLTTSGASNVVGLGMVPPTPPLAPTGLTATAQVGPQVLLSWTDNASDETGFAIERCTGAGCSNFAPLIAVGPKNGTGAVGYTDVTVAAGNTYTYRVAAVNGAGTSAWAISNEVIIPAVPPAPISVAATAVRQGAWARVTLTWLEGPNSNETGFEIQRATNAAFTANLVTGTVGPNVQTFSTGNIARNTPFYFRVRAVNGAGPSAWVNATPFPITTP
jgi:FtsP/CotA-like multicopper oxidase with cupredoxin domain